MLANINKQRCIFSVNPCAKMQNTQTSEKAIALHMNNCKKHNVVLKTNTFLKTKAGKLGTPGFSWIFDFAVVWSSF